MTDAEQIALDALEAIGCRVPLWHLRCVEVFLAAMNSVPAPGLAVAGLRAINANTKSRLISDLSFQSIDDAHSAALDEIRAAAEYRAREIDWRRARGPANPWDMPVLNATETTLGAAPSATDERKTPHSD